MLELKKKKSLDQKLALAYCSNTMKDNTVEDFDLTTVEDHHLVIVEDCDLATIEASTITRS
jgi:hypothetical protein